MSAQNVDNMKTRKFIKYTKRGDKILFDNVLSCRVIIEASKTHLDTTYVLIIIVTIIIIYVIPRFYIQIIV